jgi:hypothetical protein
MVLNVSGLPIINGLFVTDVGFGEVSLLAGKN